MVCRARIKYHYKVWRGPRAKVKTTSLANVLDPMNILCQTAMEIAQVGSRRLERNLASITTGKGKRTTMKCFVQLLYLSFSEQYELIQKERSSNIQGSFFKAIILFNIMIENMFCVSKCLGRLNGKKKRAKMKDLYAAMFNLKSLFCKLKRENRKMSVSVENSISPASPINGDRKGVNRNSLFWSIVVKLSRLTFCETAFENIKMKSKKYLSIQRLVKRIIYLLGVGIKEVFNIMLFNYIRIARQSMSACTSKKTSAQLRHAMLYHLCKVVYLNITKDFMQVDLEKSKKMTQRVKNTIKHTPAMKAIKPIEFPGPPVSLASHDPQIIKELSENTMTKCIQEEENSALLCNSADKSSNSKGVRNSKVELQHGTSSVITEIAIKSCPKEPESMEINENDVIKSSIRSDYSVPTVMCITRGRPPLLPTPHSHRTRPILATPPHIPSSRYFQRSPNLKHKSAPCNSTHTYTYTNYNSYINQRQATRQVQGPTRDAKPSCFDNQSESATQNTKGAPVSSKLMSRRKRKMAAKQMNNVHVQQRGHKSIGGETKLNDEINNNIAPGKSSDFSEQYRFITGINRNRIRQPHKRTNVPLAHWVDRTAEHRLMQHTEHEEMGSKWLQYSEMMNQKNLDNWSRGGMNIYLTNNYHNNINNNSNNSKSMDVKDVGNLVMEGSLNCSREADNKDMMSIDES